MTCDSPVTVNDTTALNFSILMHAQHVNKRVQGKQQIRHSERQKLEKEALQNELVKLHRILDKIRKMPKTHSPRTNRQEAFVRHRLKTRLTSEAHRKWLQAAVSGKTALINDLIALVHQHIRTARVLANQSHGLYDGVILQPTDELLYSMYIYELDGIYSQTDAVFKACGMDSKEETTSLQQATLSTNGETISMQFGWKQLFPFNFKPTCDSMWMLAHLLNRQDAREVFSDVKDPQNTIATKFRVTRSVTGGECEALQQRFVHRRFVEKDRVVTVWKATIMGDRVYRGMQMEQTGWCVYRPSGEGTFGQVCVRQVPLHLQSGGKACQSTAKRFDDFVQAMIQENSEETTVMAKTLLLENALNGIHV